MLWSSHEQTCPTVSYSGGVLRYTPPLHCFSATPCQPITFVMKACDNNSVDVPKRQTATIYICVLFLNHPPQFSLAVMYVLEDQTTFTSLNISAALSDVEDGTPPLNGTHILTDPAHGKAYYYNITGNVTCRPDPAYYGIDLIYVRACDTLNGCTVGNITVVVQNVNRPPSVLDTKDNKHCYGNINKGRFMSMLGDIHTVVIVSP